MSKLQFSEILEGVIKDLGKESDIEKSEHLKGESVQLGGNIDDIDRRIRTVNKVVNNVSQIKEVLSLYDSDIGDLSESELDVRL